MDIKLKIFECNPDKTPKTDWQRTEKTITFEELLEKKLPEWENIGVVVPNGFSVIDFHSGEKTNKMHYKKVIKSIFTNKMPNIMVETEKGYHLWVKKELKTSKNVINPFGINCCLYGGGDTTPPYTIVKKNNKFRKITGIKNHYAWKNTNVIDHYITFNTLKEEEQEFFKRLWKGKKIEDITSEIENLYIPFLEEKFSVKVYKAKVKILNNFNKVWDLKIDNIEEIAKVKEEVVEVIKQDSNVFWLNKEGQIKVKQGNWCLINAKNALSQFLEEYKDRYFIKDGFLYITNEKGIPVGSTIYQIDELRVWFRNKGGEVSDTEIKQFLPLIRSKADKTGFSKEFVYLLEDNKCIDDECRILDFDSKKHQVVALIPRKYKEIDKETVKKVMNEKFFPLFRQWLGIDKNNDESMKILLMHHKNALIPTKKAKKSLLIKGRKNSGKSTYMELLRKMYDMDAIKNIKIHKIFDGNFGTRALVGALIGFDDDAGTHIDKSCLGMIKSMISDSVLTIEAKYDNAYNDINYTKLWTLSNSTLKISNEEGVDNRFDMISFKQLPKGTTKANFLKSFTDEDFDVLFYYILNLKCSVDDIAKETFNKEKLEFLICNNSVFRFLLNNEVGDFAHYKNWCELMGYRKKNIEHFANEKERWYAEYDAYYKSKDYYGLSNKDEILERVKWD